ncbi:MAG: hypothetical protein GY810_29455 [Aureispira sp.]|nr:hypothetical protein [Aureispira sp.]
MNRFKYIILIGTIIFLVACQRNAWKDATKDMQTYGKQEFWYKLVTDNPKKNKPQEGEQVKIDYTLQKGDTVLDHSYHRQKPVLVQLPASQYDNFFTKALKLMGAGDSLLVKLPVELAGDLLGQYGDRFKPEELVTFTYRVHWIKDAKKLNEEIQAEATRVEAVRKMMQKTIADYAKPEFRKGLNKTGSGLRYTIIDKGSGSPAKKGKNVDVHYMCFLKDGTEVQNSYQLMNPMSFVLGSQQVIDGWAEGVELLNEGGQAILFIPPYLAYGDIGVDGAIPPNATMIFYIELLNVE